MDFENLLRGRRKIRLFDIAIIDFLGTFVIAQILSKRFNIPITTMTLIVFAAGFGAHELFGVNTKLNETIKSKLF